MLLACMKTSDGRFRVYIYADHTAEIAVQGTILAGDRLPLYRIGERLAELGVSGDDLQPA